MNQKINILIVEPGKEPRAAAVEDTLEAFQQVVGGPIEAGCYLPQRVMLVCNGKLNGGPHWNPAKRFQWGEEEGRERAQFSPEAETEQSGLSSDEGLPPNRPNPTDSGDFIAGIFLLCSFEGERFASLTPAQQAQFQAYFALPGLEGGSGQ